MLKSVTVQCQIQGLMRLGGSIVAVQSGAWSPLTVFIQQITYEPSSVSEQPKDSFLRTCASADRRGSTLPYRGHCTYLTPTECTRRSWDDLCVPSTNMFSKSGVELSHSSPVFVTFWRNTYLWPIVVANSPRKLWWQSELEPFACKPSLCPAPVSRHGRGLASPLRHTRVQFQPKRKQVSGGECLGAPCKGCRSSPFCQPWLTLVLLQRTIFRYECHQFVCEL